LENPRGNRRNTSNALNSAGTIGSANRSALAFHHHWFVNLAKRVFTNHTILAETLDVQETSVGLEADLPQGRKMIQPFVDGEVAHVVDGGLRSQAPTFLVVLLDLAALVIHVQRWNDSIGQNSGPACV
jgi:hypothetical protein